MDEFYDRVGAACALDEEARARRAMAASSFNPIFQHLADLDLDLARVTESGAHRKAWKLCIPCKDDGVLDEIVFGIQGILSNVALVPTTSGKRVLPHFVSLETRKAIRLGQRAEICGMNTQTFEEALNKLHGSHEKFQQYFGGQSILKISPQNSQFGRSIATGNRIFTMRSDYPNEQSSSFEPGVDPMGALERLTSTEIFHSPDNVVKYFRRTKSNKECTTYEEWYPGPFKIGDIVELQASLVAVQMVDNGVKITCRLHAISLLNNMFTRRSQEATLRRAASRRPPAATVAIRRRIGHFPSVVVEGEKSEGAESEDGTE
ncbi:hypothetical protein B0H16DRAFT_1454891 [Mycena metata]|uniref:Uncharacterized protein n=1 Tax=Mycena metata TaxID=1033252 RepID=A0AAD7NK16_9AGAR|nr:hypothetical protein B0H16DRAFT_1454891 [Mycena metata]